MRAENTEIEILEDLAALSRRAARILVDRIDETLSRKPFFSMALSGGSTPKPLFSMLVEEESFRKMIPWNRIHFFWGDERHVPPEHPESNYDMANKTMLAGAGVLRQNIHRVRAEISDADEVAREYERELKEFFRLKGGQLPVFDCVLQGLGTDGHTASLFPETSALSENKRLVAANWVEKLQTYRITMTLPVFNNADLVVFLVSGEDKAETLKKVLEGSSSRASLPAQLIRPGHGRLLWLVDIAAAGRLSSNKT
jgi:6-phosphogluconolactonase